MAATFGAMAVGIVAVAVSLVVFLERDKGVAPPTPLPLTTANTSAQAVDLSKMSPRQAADRLFNRIMMASEQGNLEEALRFAPMAVQAYGLVDTLDADAHYHLGLIHAVKGDIEATRKEIDAIKQIVPDHLLGLVLEHNVAEATQDKAAANQAYAKFAAAYDGEMKVGRREYADHRSTIEKFRAAAADSGGEALLSKPPDRAQPGAALFAKNCAVCHGRDAAGSEKGPPLVHETYEPDHHDDEAFYRAARQGVKAHHWQFGDMPAIPGVSDRDMGQIIAHVRALQTENGIR